MSVVRIPNFENIENDEDFVRYLRQQRKMFAKAARELASAAANTAGILKAYDKASGKRRRGRVVRPMILAAAAATLICRYMALAASRFKVEYAEEIASGKRMRRQRRQPVRRRTNGFGR